MPTDFEILVPDNLFKEISFEQFKKYVLKEQEKVLPKYFIIKKDENNPLWIEYIKWLNKTYAGTNYWNGMAYNYYGYNNNNEGFLGTCAEDSKENLKNNPELITLEYWNEYINKQTQNKTEIKMTQKLTVGVTKVLKIHEIACDTWKNTIATYLSRVDKSQNITFTQNEIDNMFSASDSNQLIVLESIFGKKVAEIDFSKLKTGSIIKVKNSGESCGSFIGINFNNPVTIIFYKTPHHIDNYGNFCKKGTYSSYITIYQNNNYGIFASNVNTDYITEVIEY